MKYFIANWKANKNYAEATAWVTEFSDLLQKNTELQTKLENGTVGIIICPPAPFLSLLQPLTKQFKNVFIGAQTVSDKESGSFTGEVTAKSLEGLCSYTILGHSERRINYGETNELLAVKTAQALKAGIKPILCVRDASDTIFENVTFIAFEPVSAIGTGSNMPAQEVIETKKTLQLPQDAIFIYGGSVNAQTAPEYLQSDEIHGFLIGGASLQPSSFLDIVVQG